MCNCAELMNFWSFDFKDILTLVVSLVTLFVTFSIPIQIMKFQRYTGLMSTYMSLEFAHAYQSVINFFHDDCACDVEMIPQKYKERYDKDFKKLRDEDVDFNLQNALHNQRRFLNDYFVELDMCRESSFFLRCRIHKEWTTNEAWVAKILIYMNKAVDNDDELFKDISCIKYEKMAKAEGLSRYLEKFYNALKSQSPKMQV